MVMAVSLLATLIYILASAPDSSGSDVQTYKEPIDRCPKGLNGIVEVFNCKCYEFQKTKTFWGNDKCSRSGGQLAKVDSREVNDFLVEKLKIHITGEDGAWIGAKREDKDKPFYWTDGKAVKYTNWADGEPDHLVLISQNCVYMKRSRFWRWATLQCTVLGLGPTIPSICQYDIANCTSGNPEENFLKSLLATPILIGVVIGSVIGGLLLCLLVCCIIVRCKSACQKYHKKKTQRRSVRYYSRPPSTCARQQSTIEPQSHIVSNETGENDLNERLVRGADAAADDGDILNVKGSTLPTASSIAAEADASRGLVVDMQTGRATVKRINGPTPTRSDNASTRALKSFKMDDGDRVSQDPTNISVQLSIEDSEAAKISIASSVSSCEENDVMLANLDNMDKPSSHPSKDIAYK